MSMLLHKPTLINLPKFLDKRGNLSFVEQEVHIPFKIKRVYWIYDVPGGETRGGHAFMKQKEFIIALSGSFDVVVDDGVQSEVYPLNRSYFGLFIPHGYWRQMVNFSTNSLAMVLSSTNYSPLDYIYDYNVFIKYRRIHE